MKADFSFNYEDKRITVKDFDSDMIYEPEKGVIVTLSENKYSEYDATECVLYFENKSDKNSGIFSDIQDSNMVLPLEIPPRNRKGYAPEKHNVKVTTMTGAIDGSLYVTNDKMSATEFEFNEVYLDWAWEGNGKIEVSCFDGRSSDRVMPFFDVTANDKGYIAAIGWTGDWKAEFSVQESGVLMKTSLKETCFYLKSGEKIRTSSVLVMEYSEDEDKYNKFRALIKNHFSHKSNTSAERDGLLAFELWGGLTSDEMIKRINELKKYDIKFEDIWIDAGWYGNCENCDDPFSGDWGAHTGEWEVNERVHPDKLKKVSECAKEAGMNLMLWLEPERAIKGTKLTIDHPEWFLTSPGRGHQILNYGNDEAFEYVCNLISDYVKELDMSCYRQDFNVGLTEFFKENDEENRRGITEIKHIMGMYRMWDYLLEKHPKILIDNCSSGGRRIDIETLKRSIPFFRTDYQCNFNSNPEVLQVHNSNISQYLPFNGCTNKTKSDTYAIRSSYSSSWGGAFYNAIFQTMDEEDFLWAKKDNR